MYVSFQDEAVTAKLLPFSWYAERMWRLALSCVWFGKTKCFL